MKELELRGIGRPSTYASIIETILDRGYVFKKGSALVPTFTAFAVISLLEKFLAHLVDYGFTARMEDDLDAISPRREEIPRLPEAFLSRERRPRIEGDPPGGRRQDRPARDMWYRARKARGQDGQRRASGVSARSLVGERSARASPTTPSPRISRSRAPSKSYKKPPRGRRSSGSIPSLGSPCI